MTLGPGIEPGTHWWKASVLTTAPTLLSSPECCFNYPQPSMRATEILYPLKQIHHHVK